MARFRCYSCGSWYKASAKPLVHRHACLHAKIIKMTPVTDTEDSLKVTSRTVTYVPCLILWGGAFIFLKRQTGRLGNSAWPIAFWPVTVILSASKNKQPPLTTGKQGGRGNRGDRGERIRDEKGKNKTKKKAKFRSISVTSWVERCKRVCLRLPWMSTMGIFQVLERNGETAAPCQRCFEGVEVTLTQKLQNTMHFYTNSAVWGSWWLNAWIFNGVKLLNKHSFLYAMHGKQHPCKQYTERGQAKQYVCSLFCTNLFYASTPEFIYFLFFGESLDLMKRWS